MNWLFFLLLVGSVQLWGTSANPETLQVRLATEEELLPIYLTGVSSELKSVLKSDLSRNGATFCVPENPKREELSCAAKEWEEQGIYFHISFRESEGKISARLWDVEEQKETRFSPLPATRESVHKLADALHKKMTGVQGIASTKILFTDKSGEGGDVWRVDYDGHAAQKLTKQNALCVTPHHIRGTEDYFYVCYKQGQPKIYHAKLSGGNGQRLLSLRGNQLMPTLSTARDQVALISDAGGNPDLFLAPFQSSEGVTGKPRQIYAVPFATQASPTFSPDGKEIAFVSNKDGRPKIYLLKIPEEGTKLNEIKPKLLIRRSWACTAPAWSPDGSKIAYTSKVEGVRQIFVYNLHTRENKQITGGAGDKENPTWAPNSLHLCYNQTMQKGTNLFTINLRQLKPQQVTFGQSEKKYPSWH